MNRPYIINNIDGNPINAKYPPDKELYGDEFGGYKTELSGATRDHRCLHCRCYKKH